MIAAVVITNALVLVSALAVGFVAGIRREGRRRRHEVAMLRLGHRDDDLSTGGWRFREVSTTPPHVHAIAPDGADWYGTYEKVPGSREYSLRVDGWVLSTGAATTWEDRSVVHRAHGAWRAMRDIQKATKAAQDE